MNQIQQDAVAVINYTLHTREGICIDKGESFAYIHGRTNILRGMETALEGKEVGTVLRADISPAEAFGEPTEHETIQIPRSEFGKSFDRIYAGLSLRIQDRNGKEVLLYVQDKQINYATLSRNHPLAGQTLVFAAKVLAVRCALPEELSSGIVYGVDGTEVPTSCACC